MPWKETTTMEARVAFILDWKSGRHKISDLCAQYGVSRKTGYKLINRFMEEGPDGLWDRSHAPGSTPNKTALEVEQAIVQLRSRHPNWGAKKLRWVLERRQPHLELPCRSTVCEILKRNELIQHKRRPRPVGHPGRPSLVVSKPNDSWSVDFKGQFRTGDGKYLYGLDPVARTGWDLISSRGDEFRRRVIHRRRGASHANADGG